MTDPERAKVIAALEPIAVLVAEQNNEIPWPVLQRIVEVYAELVMAQSGK